MAIDKNNCFIFEDSFSGYTSAKQTGIDKIVLLINQHSSNEIKLTKEIKINNYSKLTMKQLLESTNKKDILDYSELIKENLQTKYPIKKIELNEIPIKTGYICNIQLYDITYNDDSIKQLILKIENSGNELSKIANQLNMYEKEVFFYETISPKLSIIKVPQYFGLIKNNQKSGILLDNLYQYSGSFNLNLSKNIQLLLKVVETISKMHNCYYFQQNNQLIDCMKHLQTVNQIKYYQKLIDERFEKFIKQNKLLLKQSQVTLLTKISQKFKLICDCLSQYPLSFCHGDLKSPNIFYKNNQEPYFLDWQYIHLNKGVSDIVFLLVESIPFSENIASIVEKYYYELIKNQQKISYQKFLLDFKYSLCMFPFFVMIWFNSEDSDKLLDKVFPIRFMKNVLQYYDYYLDDQFIENYL